MITSWQHLSWSHAALILGLIVIASGALLLWALTPRASGHGEDWLPWPLTDYSVPRERQIAWLGERWLLARPVNRLSRRDSWRVVR